MVGTGDVHSLDGVRFFRLAEVHGISLGLDRRWFGAPGLLVSLLIALAAPAGLLSQDPTQPVWEKACWSLATVLAVAATSLGHELGHAITGRLAGLQVRAIVVGPHGGLTIRTSSAIPVINVCTALSGPFANLLLGVLCLGCALHADTTLAATLVPFAILQFVAAAINLLPIGGFDGARALQALTAQQGSRTLKTTA